MTKRTNYCIMCRSFCEYDVMSRKDTIDIRGVKVEYDEAYAICRKCGNEVYIPEINDSNIDTISKAFGKTKNDASHL